MTTRDIIDEVIASWLTYDALRASALFAPDGVYAEAGREAIVGRPAILEHFQRFFRDGPTWRFEVDDIVTEGTRAAIVYRFHVKDATERWSVRPGCAFARTNGELITEWREFSGVER